MKYCQIKKCYKPIQAKSLCKTHYACCLRTGFPTPGIREMHGMYYTPEYLAWANMKKRCNDPKSKGYINYGGRGIKVCDRWDKFTNFYEDLGNRPEGMSLERIDVNGNYEPSNCCWANKSTQAKNKRALHSSGVHHIHYRQDTKKWAVRRSTPGGRIWLGSYETLDEAKSVLEYHVLTKGGMAPNGS